MARDFRKPFRAAPLRRGKRRGWLARQLAQVTPIMVTLPLAVFTAVLLWDGGPKGFALPFDAPRPTAQDREVARFHRCNDWARNNCVIDGDTIWYAGEKIRLAGINAPEVGEPQCSHEAQLGEKATWRLLELLNQGPFSLKKDPFGDNRDRYDRLLRDVTREGKSLGDALVVEGLAEEWKGYRGSWC